jgi:hypothetical protein
LSLQLHGRGGAVSQILTDKVVESLQRTACVVVNHVHEILLHTVLTGSLHHHRVELAVEVAEADVVVGGRTRMVSGSRQGGDMCYDEAGADLCQHCLAGCIGPSNKAHSAEL